MRFYHSMPRKSNPLLPSTTIKIDKSLKKILRQLAIPSTKRTGFESDNDVLLRILSSKHVKYKRVKCAYPNSCDSKDLY